MSLNLTSLANEAGSDKGDKIYHAHDYAKLYSFLFESFRNEDFKMLEIGLHRGGVDMKHLLTRSEEVAPSAQMWLSYFPKAFLYGFDISDFSKVKMERFHFIQGDSGSEQDMDKLIRELPPLKIIIDDGSHAAYHQQFMFAKLFPKVVSGGYYIIEDLHAGHPIEEDLPKCRRTANMLEDFLASRTLATMIGSEQEKKYILDNISNTFVHRNDRGGVDRLLMKMIAFQKL